MNPENQTPIAPTQPITTVSSPTVNTQEVPVPPQPTTPVMQEVPKPKNTILPFLIILLVLVGLCAGGYWVYKNYFVQPESKPQPTTESITPTPSLIPITDNLNSLEWKDEKWDFPENSQEFFIPSVTYKISIPTIWIYKNVISDKVKGCYSISVTDPKNVVNLDIKSICTGWAGNDDKTVLPTTYVLVKKTRRIRQGLAYYQLIIRIEKTKDIITYIGGETQTDDESIEDAYFTNAVLIKGTSVEENTHSYLSAVNITAKYTGNEEAKKDYINIIDKIVSSVVMENIGYKN